MHTLMMKKTLITLSLVGVLGGLLLTACVKKEQPKDEQAESASADQTSPEHTALQPLEPVSEPVAAAPPPAPAKVERIESSAEQAELVPEKIESHEATSPVSSNANADLATSSSTEDASTDDAIAAAIRAAEPALKN